MTWAPSFHERNKILNFHCPPFTTVHQLIFLTKLLSTLHMVPEKGSCSLKYVGLLRVLSDWASYDAEITAG